MGISLGHLVSRLGCQEEATNALCATRGGLDVCDQGLGEVRCEAFSEAGLLDWMANHLIVN